MCLILCVCWCGVGGGGDGGGGCGDGSDGFDDDGGGGVGNGGGGGGDFGGREYFDGLFMGLPLEVGAIYHLPTMPTFNLPHLPTMKVGTAVSRNAHVLLY